MNLSVFNKNVPHSCEYCIYGKSNILSKQVLCIKHGVTELYDSCKSYKYDPLKRIPKNKKLEEKYSKEDFSL